MADKENSSSKYTPEHAKPSRIPDNVIAFVQHAFASGAGDRLEEKLRFFVAHAITKPHLTLEELSPFGGFGYPGTASSASNLLKEGILQLWLESPEELQARNRIADLLNKTRKRISLSEEARQLMSEMHTGHTHTSETRVKMSEARRKYLERRKQQQTEQQQTTQVFPSPEN
jgi:hypothetical protein